MASPKDRSPPRKRPPPPDRGHRKTMSFYTGSQHPHPPPPRSPKLRHSTQSDDGLPRSPSSLVPPTRIRPDQRGRSIMDTFRQTYGRNPVRPTELVVFSRERPDLKAITASEARILCRVPPPSSTARRWPSIEFKRTKPKPPQRAASQTVVERPSKIPPQPTRPLPELVIRPKTPPSQGSMSELQRQKSDDSSGRKTLKLKAYDSVGSGKAKFLDQGSQSPGRYTPKSRSHTMRSPRDILRATVSRSKSKSPVSSGDEDPRLFEVSKCIQRQGDTTLSYGPSVSINYFDLNREENELAIMDQSSDGIAGGIDHTPPVLEAYLTMQDLIVQTCILPGDADYGRAMLLWLERLPIEKVELLSIINKLLVRSVEKSDRRLLRDLVQYWQWRYPEDFDQNIEMTAMVQEIAHVTQPTRKSDFEAGSDGGFLASLRRETPSVIQMKLVDMSVDYYQEICPYHGVTHFITIANRREIDDDYKWTYLDVNDQLVVSSKSKRDAAAAAAAISMSKSVSPKKRSSRKRLATSAIDSAGSLPASSIFSTKSRVSRNIVRGVKSGLMKLKGGTDEDIDLVDTIEWRESMPKWYEYCDCTVCEIAPISPAGFLRAGSADWGSISPTTERRFISARMGRDDRFESVSTAVDSMGTTITDSSCPTATSSSIAAIDPTSSQELDVKHLHLLTQSKDGLVDAPSVPIRAKTSPLPSIGGAEDHRFTVVCIQDDSDVSVSDSEIYDEGEEGPMETIQMAVTSLGRSKSATTTTKVDSPPTESNHLFSDEEDSGPPVPSSSVSHPIIGLSLTAAETKATVSTTTTTTTMSKFGGSSTSLSSSSTESGSGMYSGSSTSISEMLSASSSKSRHRRVGTAALTLGGSSGLGYSLNNNAKSSRVPSPGRLSCLSASTSPAVSPSVSPVGSPYASPKGSPAVSPSGSRSSKRLPSSRPALTASGSVDLLTKKATLRLEAKKRKWDEIWPHLTLYFRPKFPKGMSSLEINPIHVAQALTLLKKALFAQIKPREFLKREWKKSDEPNKAKHLRLMIDLFEAEAKWAQMELVREINLEERMHRLKRLLKVNVELIEHGNYDSACAIRAGIFEPHISKLRMKNLTGKHQTTVDSLSLFDDSRHRNIKQLVSDMMRSPDRKPFIPALAPCLEKLYRIEEVWKPTGSVGKRKDCLVHVKWLKGMYNAAKEIFVAQNRLHQYEEKFVDRRDIQLLIIDEFKANSNITTEKMVQMCKFEAKPKAAAAKSRATLGRSKTGYF